jgi:predicted nucleotidyltransferase
VAAATLPEVLELLRSRRDDARAVGIELVGVVGSLARGEARADSDVDVIVHYLGDCSLFKLFDFEAVLQKALGRSVDLVFSEAMRPERRAYIERDLVRL